MSNVTTLLTTVILGILKDSISFCNTSFGISVLHDSLDDGQISVAGGLDDRFLGKFEQHEISFVHEIEEPRCRQTQNGLLGR